MAETLPFFRDSQGGLQRTHPFDKHYGVDTSGTFPTGFFHGDVLGDVPGGAQKEPIHPYIGFPPSITRRALSTLPDLMDYTFVEIGCGKGRSVIVGSEFPFKEIVGLELSSDLVRIARSNIGKIERHFPGRPPMRIVEGDALDHLVLTGKVVFNNFHSLPRDVLKALIQKIEAGLAKDLEHAFFIFQNPVYGEVLDASPAFRRWFADQIPYEPEELGIGAATSEGVAIWQSVKGALSGALPGADRDIVIVEDRWVARVADAATPRN